MRSETPRPSAPADRGQSPVEDQQNLEVRIHDIHGADITDPAVKQYGDGADRLNPKRYRDET